MSLLLLTIAAAIHSAPTTERIATRDNCPKVTTYAAEPAKTPKARRLGELPDANLYSAIYRTVGGCMVPVIIKYGVARR